jgi:hypothetical protein
MFKAFVQEARLMCRGSLEDRSRERQPADAFVGCR